MAVRRNAGPKPTKRPHLLDRAVRARPVAVHRRRKPLYRNPIVVALVVGVGTLVALRATGHFNPSQMVRAAQGLHNGEPTPSALTPKRPANWTEFLQATSRPTPLANPVAPTMLPASAPTDQPTPQANPTRAENP
jgi:hypothetical protein